MAVAQGSFTVGTGADYASWDLAIADIDATLTGDLTFTQIAAVPADGGTAAAKAVALAGFTLKLTSDTPHLGRPAAGHLTSLTGAADSNHIIPLQVTGTGKLEIEQLNLRRTGTPTASNSIDVETQGPDVDIHDCIAISSATAGTTIGVKTVGGVGAGSGTDINVWNCAISGFTTGGSLAAGNSSVLTVENCTVWDCATNIDAASSDGTFINNVAFDQTATADFANTGSATGTNNASEDATAGDGNWNTGTGNITTIVPGTEFVSVLTSSADMVKVASGGSLDDGGTTTTITANTTGIRGNARPGDANYSIGADELVINPTVTLVNPNDGEAAGGTPVTITGTGFVAGAVVRFAAAAATSVVVVGPTSITCVTPAGVGVVDVSVTNTDSGVGTLAGGFSYLGGLGSEVSVSVSHQMGEAGAGIFRTSPGLGDMLNKVADNLAYIKEASQQDNFAEFKLAMEDLDPLGASPRPRYFEPAPRDTSGPIQVPARTGEGFVGLNRAQTSEMNVGLRDVLNRVATMLAELKAASQLTDFAAFKAAMANLSVLTKSDDSRV
jgi:hypothetical protein